MTKNVVFIILIVSLMYLMFRPIIIINIQYKKYNGKVSCYVALFSQSEYFKQHFADLIKKYYIN